MTTNLPANIETLSVNELMMLSGQKQEFMGSSLPTLRVNYDDQSDDEKEIPRGYWTITANGVTAFAKEVLFQPIYTTLQYSHYNDVTAKMVATSIHFQSWSDEVPDSAGGFKCGKVTKKEFEKLPDAEKIVQKKIKLARVVFGFVSLVGEDVDKNPVELVNEPCMFYARGTNYMPVDDYLGYLVRKGKPMQTVTTKLSLKREKKEKVTFWTVILETVEDHPVTKVQFDALKDFSATVNAENEQIIEKWKKARAKGSSSSAKELVARVVGREVDLGPNDNLPANLSGDLDSDFNDAPVLMG